MNHSEQSLTELAEMVIHAYKNPQNIYHDVVKRGIYLLIINFNLTEFEVISKIKELKGN